MAGLGRKGSREIVQIDPVNPFPPRGSPLMIKLSGIRQSIYMYIYKITKGLVLTDLGGKGLKNVPFINNYSTLAKC